MVTFSAAQGQTFYIIVDGKNGARGHYHVSLSGAPGTCAAPTCLDGNNSLDCFSSFTRSVMGANNALGATNDISAWGPASMQCDTGTTGPEFAHRFTPPGAGPFTVTLSGQQADLDLIILEAPTAACNAAAPCVGASSNGSTADESLTFTADPAKNYWFVVDGRNGASSPYTLTVAGTGCP
jgi:hypothetical protein